MRKIAKPTSKKRRDSRAPAVQLTQEIGRLPRDKGKSSPAKQKKPGLGAKIVDFFKRMEQKSKEASATPRSKLAASEKVVLPTDCVAAIIGVPFSDQPQTTFEKKGGSWFVDGVDSQGVIGDDIVKTMASYCKTQKSASTTPRRVKTAAPVSTSDEMWNAVKAAFMQAIEDTRQAVIDELEAEGLTGYEVGEADDFTDEEYRYNFAVYHGDEPGVDVSFTLAESGPHDGIDEGEEGWGVNFMVDITAIDGRILGGFAPYNYTPEVWTNDVDELLERISYMDPSEAAYLVVEDLLEQQAEGRTAMAKKQVPRIIIEGAVYKQAQLQELLQQYETASSQIIKTLTQAHQAALGKDFGKSNQVLKKLEGVIDDKALKQLMELNDTMAGVVGLEGNN